MLRHQTLSSRIQAAVESLAAILRERPIKIGASGGKDSTVCVILVLRAARAILESGGAPYPVILSSSDTGVENPEVTALLHALHRNAATYASTHGFELISRIVGPTLNQAWWPRMLSGRKLPSYIGQNGDCSVELKIRPQERLARELKRELKRRGLPEPVTVIGTRRDESARRAANMGKRGEVADRVVEGVIAPIADWSTDDVMVTLIDRDIEKFDHDYRSLIRFYGDAAGGECIITPEHRVGAAQGGCSARSGCFVCQKVSEDHSMRALVAKEEYSYLRPLHQLNRYLAAIRWDLGRRHWIGRDINPVTRCVRIAPNCFSFEECDRLLRMLLTIDLREKERACRQQRALDRGEIEDTPSARRLAGPQFTNIDLRALIGIDFMRSVDCFGPAHSALAAWRDVYVERKFAEIPEIGAVERPTSLPEPKFAPVSPAPLHGLADPALLQTGAEGHNRINPETGETELVCPDADGAYFDIDEEGAQLVFSWELGERLAAAEKGLHPASAARYYLRMGTVTLAAGYTGQLDQQMRRAQALYDAGVGFDADLSDAELLDERDHDALLQQRAREAGILSHCGDSKLQRRRLTREVLGAIAETRERPAIDDLRYWIERHIGLTCARASGVRSFDGQDVAKAVRAAEVRVRRIREALDVPAHQVDEIRSAAWDRAEAAARGADDSETSSGLYPWIVLGAGMVSGERPFSARQRSLLSAA